MSKKLNPWSRNNENSFSCHWFNIIIFNSENITKDEDKIFWFVILDDSLAEIDRKHNILINITK